MATKFNDIRDTWKPGDEVPEGYYVGKITGELWKDEPLIVRGKSNSGFQIISDIEPYVSVITKELIGGRKQHRDHLRAHNCVEVGNDLPQVKKESLPDPRADIMRARNEGMSQDTRDRLRRAQQMN